MRDEDASKRPGSIAWGWNAAHGAALLLLLLIGVASYKTTIQMVEDARWVTHTHEVLENIKSLESNLNDVESARRGYILAGSADDVGTFHSVLQSIRPQIEKLRNLTADNPQEQTRLKNLDLEVAARLQLLLRSIELRQIHTDDAAEQRELTREGKKRMEQAGLILSAMETEERRLLQDRREKAALRAEQTKQLNMVGVVVAFLFVGFAGVVLHREIRFRQQAKQERQRAYEELEIKIRERTAGFAASNASLQKEIAVRKQAEQDLRRVNRALQTLSECNRALSAATEEIALLQEICRILVAHGGYRIAWVGFAELDAEKHVRVAASGGYEVKYLQSAGMTWSDEKHGQGPTGTAIRSGKVCLTRNIVDDPAYEVWRSAADHRGYASCISFPLFPGGEKGDGKTPAFGALSIYAAETSAFDAEEVELLTELAHHLAYRISFLNLCINPPGSDLQVQTGIR